MSDLRKHFEDIRDKGGLAVLRNIPVGKTINFYGHARLKAVEVVIDPRSDDDPCKDCYFYENKIPMRSLRQCAVWKYCTSPHRLDNKSIMFIEDEKK